MSSSRRIPVTVSPTAARPEPDEETQHQADAAMGLGKDVAAAPPRSRTSASQPPRARHSRAALQPQAEDASSPTQPRARARGAELQPRVNRSCAVNARADEGALAEGALDEGAPPHRRLDHIGRG